MWAHLAKMRKLQRDCVGNRLVKASKCSTPNAGPWEVCVDRVVVKHLPSLAAWNSHRSLESLCESVERFNRRVCHDPELAEYVLDVASGVCSISAHVLKVARQKHWVSYRLDGTSIVVVTKRVFLSLAGLKHSNSSDNKHPILRKSGMFSDKGSF